MLRVFFAAALVLSLAADVAPGCLAGPKRSVVNPPGEECGDHGSRWHADCRAPSACWQTSDHGLMCTKACTTDADCAALGAGFTCSATGRPSAEYSARNTPICSPSRDR